jgi:hypothetical protein
MLKEAMMQEIIDLKMKGYSINEILKYYEDKPGKAPSRPTVRKYYKLDSIPDEPGANLVKDKAFDVEPWKSVIMAIIKNNYGKCYGSSVYDVLMERFIETGEYEAMPGSERTLRTYIRYLIQSGQMEVSEPEKRIYEHVFDTPPGKQMLIDFGELRIKAGLNIHFICMLLRYSRVICVFAQDHKYNAQEACRAIYHGFCKLGGRPTELVIDQDSVFIASEYLGEVIETNTFKDFVTEQGLKLWVCNKNDPESKGPVENVVGFVKKNFFSARQINCIDDVWRSLPGWTERKNKRIHQATYRIPAEVFTMIEKPELRALIPSVYDITVSSFIGINVGSQPYIQYKSSRYSVPREFCFKKIYYKAVADKLHIYGPDLKYKCTHDVSPCKGTVKKLSEHAKLESANWVAVCERLRKRWNCYDFQHFINGFKKENPRHLFKQLSAVEDFLEHENPDRDLTAAVIAECCRNFRCRFTQFRAEYYLVKARFSGNTVPSAGSVQQADLTLYQKAFLERCDN